MAAQGTISVLVNGATGKMGQKTVQAIDAASDLTLVGALNSHDNLAEALTRVKPQVVVDFTLPSCVYDNALTILAAGCHPVIGTTGLTETQIQDLQARAAAQKLGGLIAPNFSIAVVLMMQFAKRTAQYYGDVEIIEGHNPLKQDAPSGTAIKTAELIARARTTPKADVIMKAGTHPARGAAVQDIAVHALRLPGMIAQQEVIFGGTGELFTLRHDTLDRAAFMPGVCLACREVVNHKELAYGLEHYLNFE